MAGSFKRAKAAADRQTKMHKVMSEFKEGSLKSSSGRKVTNRKQAIAIGTSESGQTRKKKKKRR